MNWPRTRTWIGEHPILVVGSWSIMVTGALLAVYIVIVETLLLGTLPPQLSAGQASALWMAAFVLGGVAVAGVTCWVALVRARAGLSVIRVAFAALPSLLITLVADGLTKIVGVPGIVPGPLPRIIYFGVDAGLSGGCILIGTGVAAAIKWGMIRRGKWETIMPVKLPAEPKERP